MHGVDANYWFAIKCLMKDIPFKILIVALTVSVFMLGYCLRIYEAPLSDASG